VYRVTRKTADLGRYNRIQVTFPGTLRFLSRADKAWSSKPGEFHPKFLTEPDVTVSRHPALPI